MDITSRLKSFMEAKNITSSQFADTCKISRPTLSQILTGRNKKISDELISKIHVAYPTLSILWLMFGEGDMMTDANFKISEPQNGEKSLFDDIQMSEHEIFADDETDFDNVRKNTPENFERRIDLTDGLNEASQNHSPLSPSATTASTNTATSTRTASTDTASSVVKKIAELTPEAKRINSIVVFYDDNTFQTFLPFPA